jgi:amidohydrolase
MPIEKSATKTNLLEQARQIEQETIACRRHIHENPELSFQEVKTAALITEKLKELGYKVTPAARTGVVGELGEGKTIAIRADMDALPLQEENPEPYRSKQPGVMHACGHDAHVACGLSAAKLLADQYKKGSLKGKIRFLFQPSEEAVDDEGKSGASLLVEEGWLKDVQALIGLHVFPNMPTGHIALRKGSIFAACDTFDITIKGVGGHAAFPERAVDPVVLAATIVQSMQTLVSRRKSPVEPALITLGGIRSSSYKSNVIPETVQLTGTMRYFEKSARDLLYAEMKNILSIADKMGGSYSIEYRTENPALSNDHQLTDTVGAVAAQLLGADKVITFDRILGSEDFSFYTEHAPCCFLILGCQPGDHPRNFHGPHFDIDESALAIGTAMLAQTALHLLED